MTSDWLGELFEGDSADMCAGKFPLMSMEGRAEGLACADPGARTPIGVSRILLLFPCGICHNEDTLDKCNAIKKEKNEN